MISQKPNAEVPELFALQDAERTRIVGTSDAMRRVQRQALLAARLNVNVLVTGERGVGKALVAHFIHEQSDRSIHRFATIDCDGLPDLLFQSALFGHVKDSFAGAYRDRPGWVESAAAGTILLSDVGGLSPKMQARLLWFLETGEYLRVGDTCVRTQRQSRFDLSVRVIASTTANCSVRATGGLFLDDLYRLLSDVRICVPALRERREDIPSLVDHFVTEVGGRREISGAVRDALCRADWPGNVRELKSFVLGELQRNSGLATPLTQANS